MKALKVMAGGMDLAARANANHAFPVSELPEEYNNEVSVETREGGRERQGEFSREAMTPKTTERILKEVKRNNDLSLQGVKANGTGASGGDERAEGQGRKKGGKKDVSGHHMVAQGGDKVERKGKEEAQEDGVRPEKPRKKKEKAHCRETSGARTCGGGERMEGNVRKQGGEEETSMHCEEGQVGDKVGRKGKGEAQAGDEGREKSRRKKDIDYGIVTSAGRASRVDVVTSGGSEGFVKAEKKKEKENGVSEQEVGAKNEGDVAKEFQRGDKDAAGAVRKISKREKRTKAEEEMEEPENTERRVEENESKGGKRNKEGGKLMALEAMDGGKKAEIGEEEQADDGDKIGAEEEGNEVDAQKLRVKSKRERKKLRKEERKRRKLEAMKGVGEKGVDTERLQIETEEEKGQIESKMERKRLRRKERERRKLEAMEAVEKMQEHVDIDIEGTEIGEPKPKKKSNKAKKNTLDAQEEKAEEVVENLEEENEGEGREQGEEEEIGTEEMENTEVEKKRIKSAKERERKDAKKRKRREMDMAFMEGLEVEGGIEEGERRKEKGRSEEDDCKAAEPEVMPGKVKKGKEERGMKEKHVEAVDQEERMPLQGPWEAGPSDQTAFANRTASSLENFRGFIVMDQGQPPSAFLYWIQLPEVGDRKSLLISESGSISLCCLHCDGVAAKLHPFSGIAGGVSSRGHPEAVTTPAYTLESRPRPRPAPAALENGEEGPRVHMDQSGPPAVLTLDTEVAVDRENANGRRKEKKAEKTAGDVKEVQRIDVLGNVDGQGGGMRAGGGGNEAPLDEEGHVSAEGTKAEIENVKEKKQRRKKKRTEGENENETEAAGGDELESFVHGIPVTAAASLGRDRVDLDMDMDMDRVEGQTRMNEIEEIENQDGVLDHGNQVEKSGKSKTRKKKKERLVASGMLPPGPPVEVKLSENRGASNKAITPPPEVRCEEHRNAGAKFWYCRNLKVAGGKYCEKHIILRTAKAERRKARRWGRAAADTIVIQ